MRPFLLLSIRADDPAADNEYESFLNLGGLREGELKRTRLERGPLGDVDLADWSGIVLGGGPFNYTDPEEAKSAVQRRVEADLNGLLDAVVGADFPFLGACYGVGALGTHQGAVLGRRYPEPVGPVRITLTRQGRRDPLMSGLPASFDAFTGHKEAISKLPGHAVLLASSQACPVQAFRFGSNVYATQFHPELDVTGMCTRVDAYKYAGYFEPHQADEVKAVARASQVSHPPEILRAFVRRYASAEMTARTLSLPESRRASAATCPASGRCTQPNSCRVSSRSSSCANGGRAPARMLAVRGLRPRTPSRNAELRMYRLSTVRPVQASTRNSASASGWARTSSPAARSTAIVYISRTNE
jgi:GMP synthase (glutamine-hydrolysing)